MDETGEDARVRMERLLRRMLWSGKRRNACEDGRER